MNSGGFRRAAGWITLLGLFLPCVGFPASPQRLLVRVPVADLRSDPRPYQLTGGQDPGEQTQVLYGEVLWVDGEKGDWWHVEVPSQPAFRYAKAWRGYPGWIRKDCAVPAPADWPSTATVVVSSSTVLLASDPRGGFSFLHLSLGTELVTEPSTSEWTKVRCVGGTMGRIRTSHIHPLEAAGRTEDARRCVVQEANHLLGVSYLWGGLSASGVDCSGLVHLAYRSCGVVLPRDARDQKLKTQPIAARDLVPGDLIFVADPKDPTVALHVSIYAGGDELIEAPSTGLSVRRVRFEEKFGKSLQEIASGALMEGRLISFGRVIRG